MFKKQANTIRFLCADMVQAANSGHPGAPMGLAEIMTALMRVLRHNPKDPSWLNRDRLVFSGGHASSLAYAFLHLSGYDVSMDDLNIVENALVFAQKPRLNSDLVDSFNHESAGFLVEGKCALLDYTDFTIG